MIEIYGDLFRPGIGFGAICITTNGITRKDGAAVMGRGVALQATKKWPGIEYVLGELIQKNGNTTQRLTSWGEKKITLSTHDEVYDMPFHIISLPVKHHWGDQADVGLIERSLKELIYVACDVEGKIALPRPGCGNGGLSWGKVQFLVQRILAEDRYIVVERNV